MVYLHTKLFKRVAFLASALVLFACSDSANQVEVVEQVEIVEQTEVVVKVAPELDHPNVLFIFLDDMGQGDVGYNGSEIATPSLDELARSGVKLDRNYVYPICCLLYTSPSPRD